MLGNKIFKLQNNLISQMMKMIIFYPVDIVYLLIVVQNF